MSRNVALIGFGAIGRSLARRLAATDGPKVSDVLVRPGRAAELKATADWPESESVTFHENARSLCRAAPDLVVECAGQQAVREHVQAPLEAGIDVLVASSGALGETELLSCLTRAARQSGATLNVCAGAVGGIDALSAARLAGLDSVTYTSRKPPAAFHGTPADRDGALDRLAEPRLLFFGPADEAARAYHKNANVAMTVALAGLGAARTTVRIYADPGVSANMHEITAEGQFGRLALRLENAISPDNPKTSLLTILSLERAIRGGDGGFSI